MRLLRAADRVAVPWKNGGGVTREVASFPPGAGLDEFGWRVSIADVATAGPFSQFLGVDRILTVLEGRLALRFMDGGREVMLDPGQPFAFPGDILVDGAPVGRALCDLNVMVRRGLWRARVEPWRSGLNASGVRIALATASTQTISKYDALQLDSTDLPPEEFTGYLVQIEPAS